MRDGDQQRQRPAYSLVSIPRPVKVSRAKHIPKAKARVRVATQMLTLDVCTGYAFRVCGNYCGPGWCNAKWEKEVDCDDSVSACLH